MRSLPSGCARIHWIETTPYRIAIAAHASAKMTPPDMLIPLKRAGILAGPRALSARLPGQSADRPVADVLDAALARDPAEFRRLDGIGRGPAAVELLQRPGLRQVDLQSLAHGLLAVVVALHQRLAGHVVLALHLRRVEFHVVSAARSEV